MVDTAKIKLEAFHISPVFNDEDRKKLMKRNKQGLQGSVKLIKVDDTELEIDFIGFHTSLINAYRRIILAEVPTMAIEKVYMYNNTSIVQDEVLAHRLGLVPLNVDPRLFEFRSEDAREWGPEDTVKYELKIRCSKKRQADPSTSNIDDLYENRKVLSSSLKWIPIGNQGDTFPAGSLGPIHDDILLAKMNPGHEIHLEAYAVKGIASDHAKFQPGIAWYRLLPQIELTRSVEGNDALLLQKCFSPGVIGVETDSRGKSVAKVIDSRYDSCSRNVYQYDSIKDSVNLTRDTDHIIFHVESHSFLKSREILEQAVSIMVSKCDLLIVELNKYLETEELDEDDDDDDDEDD